MALERSSKNLILTRETGQIVVEYVLLLVVGVSIAALITSTMVSRNPDSPGFLVQKWVALIQFVGEDTADDLKPADQPPTQ